MAVAKYKVDGYRLEKACISGNDILIDRIVKTMTGTLRRQKRRRRLIIKAFLGDEIKN
jgi:hypothetical protein